MLDISDVVSCKPGVSVSAIEPIQTLYVSRGAQVLVGPRHWWIFVLQLALES